MINKKPVNKEIEGFLNKLKLEFNPEKIILFWGRADGDRWRMSDYNFIIVSSKFEGMHWLKRISKIVRLWDIITDIDVLPYTPKEFDDKKKNSSVVRNALKHGKSIVV